MSGSSSALHTTQCEVAFLTTFAAQWERLDPAQYPFMRQVAAQLPGHDDRDQFLAGIDLILAGITTAR